ncbi:MAG TPA: endo-1,4-beta-xylanase [Actinomycetota bacterium]|nr:endo-1,4-beta-xylanase [Actinomycetota bacterium]
MTRRSFLARGGAVAAAVVGGGVSTLTRTTPALAAPTGQLYQAAAAKGILYGSSTATWQFEPDPGYAALFAREAGMLFTEDDLLWYRLKPTPTAPLDFSFGDAAFAFAQANAQSVFAAHLVWDEGLGEGWPPDALYFLTEQEARDHLYGTIEPEVARYAGQTKAWVCCNEITDGRRKDANGFWTVNPWYQTIGPTFAEEAFFLANQQDPNAILIMNEFGTEQGSAATSKRTSVLAAIDYLQSRGAPIHALGIEAHLTYQGFANSFNATAFRTFLSQVAARGLNIFITELDVLDDGLKANIAQRDAGVAQVYSTFLTAALQEPAVKIVVTFGLSDRYTWLQEDFPRTDGAPRRPLPFDESLQPKPAYTAILNAFNAAPTRTPI